MKIISIWLFCSLSPVLHGLSQEHFGPASLLTEYLDFQRRQIGFQGVVLVSNDSEILFRYVDGWSSRELNVPLSINSGFKIASMTKTFTGALIALAEQEGKLNPDDRLDRYFPELKDPAWRRISIRQTLAHTSGIPHWQGYKNYWTVKSRLPQTQEQILDDIFQMDLLFEPGSSFSYSSPGYYLLAVILEKVYENSYEKILQEKITNLLKMEYTGCYSDLKIIPGMTSGYHMARGDSLIAAPFRDISSMKGGGHLYSNATDLLKWHRSFLSDSVWDPAFRHAALTPLSPYTIPHKDGARYGSGWYIHAEDADQPQSWQSGGGTFGYSCASAIYPEERLILIILSNVSFLPVDQMRKDMENILFGKSFIMPEDPKKISLSQVEFEKYAGMYTASANGVQLLIFRREDQLFAKLGGNPPFEIYPESGGSFFARKVNVQFTFRTDPDGKVTGLETKGRGRTDFFEKL